MAKSRLVAVDFPSTSNYAGIHYAFRTILDASYGSILGHKALTALEPVGGLIFKANAPKPARATKEFATGIHSSFIDDGAYSSASAAGWSITPSKISGSRATNTRFAQVVYITVNGIKYGWSIRKSLYRKIQSSLNALGVKPALPTDNLVFGASFPKPPIVKIKITQGAEVVTAMSYFDPSNKGSLAANFSYKEGKYNTTHWGEIAL